MQPWPRGQQLLPQRTLPPLQDFFFRLRPRAGASDPKPTSATTALTMPRRVAGRPPNMRERKKVSMRWTFTAMLHVNGCLDSTPLPIRDFAHFGYWHV